MYAPDPDECVLELTATVPRWPMAKPHLRKCADWASQAYHCSYEVRPGHYWHTYGHTGHVAYEKMMARIHRHG